MKWALVTLVYVAGSVVFLWPMPAHLGTAVWGDRFDAWTTLWLMDHLHRHLAAGTLTAVTTDILFPVGYNLWSFGHAALQALGVGLMFLGVPLVASYNLLLLAGFATSALGAHALGRGLSGGHLGGFVAGITFATSPYLYGEGAAGCIELVAAGLIPVYALTLVRIVRAPSWRTAVVSAGVLAVIGPFNWYYTLFAGMLGIGFLVWRAIAFDRAVAWILAAMIGAAAVDAPLIPLVRRETPTRPPLEPDALLDLDVWKEKAASGDGQIALQDLSEARLERYDAMQVVENATTLEALASARFTLNPLHSTPGALAFVVGIVGAVVAGRRGAGWAGIGIVATVFTLGPYLRLDETPPVPEWALRWPLPYFYAYEYLPFFSKAYRPYRIGVITLTCCAALGAVGIATLAAEVRRGLLPGVVVLGLVAVSQPFWSGERPAARPLVDARIPDIYGRLAELPAGAVIEVPLHYQPLTIANARFQYNQVRHGHPTLNCNQLIRRTDLLAFRDYVTGNSFVATLIDLGRREPPLRFTGADLNSAVASGFRYVVLHTLAEADEARLSGNETLADLVAEPAVRMLRDTFGEPVLTGDGAEVYELRPVAEGVYTWTGEDVVDIEVPGQGLGLPLRFDALPLWEGPAREVLFWVRPEEGTLSVRSGEKVVPVAMRDGHWNMVRLPVTGDVVLVGPATVRLAKVQVVR